MAALLRLNACLWRSMPETRLASHHAWAACYNMSWTRKLKACCYDKPMAMIGFEVITNAASASKSDFTYYLCVEQVRTTRRAVRCCRKDGNLHIDLPLHFESSIALFSSHYEHVATCWQCDALGFFLAKVTEANCF